MGDDAVFIDDPLGAYLFAVRQVPAMDQAEEIACIEHVKAREICPRWLGSASSRRIWDWSYHLRNATETNESTFSI